MTNAEITIGNTYTVANTVRTIEAVKFMGTTYAKVQTSYTDTFGNLCRTDDMIYFTEANAPVEEVVNNDLGKNVVATTLIKHTTFVQTYTGKVVGYTSTGKVKVKGYKGIKCFAPCNVKNA